MPVEQSQNKNVKLLCIVLTSSVSSSDEQVDVKFLNVTVKDQMFNINNGKVVKAEIWPCSNKRIVGSNER